jgi:hypothetical protein
MIPIIGFEGAVILSIIAIVSLGLAGVRFSFPSSRPGPKGRSANSGSAPRRTIARTDVRTASWMRNTSGFFLRSMSLVWAFVSFPLRMFKGGLDKPSNGTVVTSPNPVSQPASSDIEVAAPSATEASAGVEEPDERMDTQTQWARVSRIVEGGIEKANEIEALHEAAGRQLDAVDYAYERMLLELSEVLPDVTENRSVCRANRDEAYAEAAVAYAADLAGEVAEQLAEEAAGAEERAGRKSRKKKKSQQESVAA